MRFPGILPAATTPFAADGTIDVDALRANLDALLEAGVHGFVACGTMGEAAGLQHGLDVALQGGDVDAVVGVERGGGGGQDAGESHCPSSM